MDVAGEGEQVFGLYHLHALFSRRARGFFQVEFARDGDHEDIVRSAFARGHESFENLTGVFVQNSGDFFSRRGGRAVKEIALVRDFFGVQKTHDIGLFFLLHVHIIAAKRK